MSAIEIASALGLAFVQDAGRPGRAAEGIPPGGALVPEDLATANLAVGNFADAAGIERFGALRLRAHGCVSLADEAGRRWQLGAGEELALEWDGAARARYLAIGGGLDVPIVLGGRGTIVSI